VVSRSQFDSSDDLIQRAETAMKRASSFETPTVIFLSKPFVFDDEDETKD